MSDEQRTSVFEMDWVKSSYSDNAGGNCVEVAARTDLVHVRDSKDTHGPRLTVGRTGWTRFVRYATTG